MTNQDILRIATEQSAIDSNCKPEDFFTKENQVVISKLHSTARRYLTEPFLCDLTSYGTNIVASVTPELAEAVAIYIDRFPVGNCFETPNLYVLNEILKPYDAAVCFMAEYFLPDLELLKPLPCPYEMRLLLPKDFAHCYTEEWSNALSEKRKHLDRLAMGAFHGEKLIGLAGCSADCDTMWQIGIDVLPDYCKQGVAAALTAALALEILERGIIPFYCAAWSNLKSVRNALKSGFKPAWVQVTAKQNSFIMAMNQSSHSS